MNGRLTTILVAAAGLGATGLGVAWTAMNQPLGETLAAAPDAAAQKLASAERRVKMRDALAGAEQEKDASAAIKHESEQPMADDPDLMVEVSARELGASEWMEQQHQTAYLYTGPVREVAPSDEQEALARPGTPASLVRQEENLLREHPELQDTIERNRTERQALVEHGEPVAPSDP